MKIGILTGGGDCPGLNAAIRAVVRAASRHHDRVLGIREGWQGLYTKDILPLTPKDTTGLLSQGGTILGGSRDNPLKLKDGLRRCIKNFRSLGLNAIISIGGEGTLKIADVFSKAGIPVVCVPKTIDNDTWGTDTTIGFDTAVQIATDAIDRLHTTAESHNRVMIIEVMGRHAGWIATYSGIAGGADAILVPEEIFPLSELLKIIRVRARRGRHFTIAVVSEDARIRRPNGRILKTPLRHDEYGDVKLGGIGELLARELRKHHIADVRVTVLGHVQRGGIPTAWDRLLATRLGVFAVQLVHQGKFGTLVALQGHRVTSLPIAQASGKLKTTDPEILEMARVFFG